MIRCKRRWGGLRDGHDWEEIAYKYEGSFPVVPNVGLYEGVKVCRRCGLMMNLDVDTAFFWHECNFNEFQLTLQKVLRYYDEMMRRFAVEA